MDNYTRKLSHSERIYLVGEKMAPPFCIQMIIEYEGNVDPVSLNDAIIQALNVNPGAQLLLKNSKWVRSKHSPKIIFFSEDNWNEIINKPLNPRQGHTSEVYLSNKKIIFKALHSTMDARGLLEWVKDIFRILNSKTPLGTNSNTNDFTILKNRKRNLFRKKIPMNCLSPTGSTDSSTGQNEYDIERLTLKGHVSGLVAQIAQISTDLTHRKGRFMIPVDLRPDHPKIRTTGNLSNPLFIETTPGESWTTIQADILKKMQKEKYYAYGKWDHLLKFSPYFASKYFFNLLTKFQHQRNEYLLSSIISNIGKVDFNDFSTSTINAKSIYFLPVNIPLVPYSVVTVENPDHIEITISMHKKLSSKNRLKKFINHLKQNIEVQDIKEKIFSYSKIEYNYEYPKDQTVDQIITEQCLKSPNNTAVKYKDRSITYLELEQKSNRLANYLVSKGSGEGKIVALFSEHSIETIISILGIIKSGAAYLPIDPKYPAERIYYLIENSKAHIFLSAQKNLDKTLNFSIPLLSIFDLDLNNFSDTKQFQMTSLSSHSLAYVIYTSGSTGKPKGVAIMHQSLINYCHWAIRTYLGKGSFIFPLYSSLSFDLTVTSIFVPLFSGNTIEIYGSEYSGLSIKKIFQSSHINFIKATPSHLKIIKDLEIKSSGLKVLVVGGEELTTELANTISKKFNHQIKIYNEYGPTEATIGCICHLYDPNKDQSSRCVPIGRPIQNISIRINSNKHSRCGELLIGGECLAKEYLNNSEKNEEKFILVDGKRYYKSGDLVSWNDSNTLDYIGRIDEQVKINGFRIELGEIESVIQKIKEVRHVTVLALSSGKEYEEKILCAYLVVSASISKESIINNIKVDLPSYMIPSQYLFIEQIPTTINGKIDKSKLPAPQVLSKYIRTEMTAQNTLYTKLKFIWNMILNLPDEDENDDTSFYELGGNSIQFLTFLSKLKDDILPEEDEEHLLNTLRPALNEPNFNNIYSLINETFKVDLTSLKIKIFNAKKSDDKKVIELILASSSMAYAFVFESCSKDFKDFLNFAYHKGEGFFGYKNQKVGIIDNKIVFVSTFYPGKNSFKIFIQSVLQVFIFYKLIDIIKIIGKIIKIRHTFKRPQREGIYMANLCTQTEYRGRGVASSFIDYAKKYAKEQKYKKLELDVYLSNNKAIKLYQKMGFNITDKKLKKNESNFNSIHMEYLIEK